MYETNLETQTSTYKQFIPSSELCFQEIMATGEPAIFAEVDKLLAQRSELKTKRNRDSAAILFETVCPPPFDAISEWHSARELLAESLMRERELERKQTSNEDNEDDDRSTVLLTLQNNICAGGYGPGFRQDIQYCMPWKRVKGTALGERFGTNKFVYVAYDMSLPSKASEEDKQISTCIDTLTGTEDNEAGEGTMEQAGDISVEHGIQSVTVTTESPRVKKETVERKEVLCLYDAEMDDGAGELNVKELNSITDFVPPTRFITCRAFS